MLMCFADKSAAAPTERQAGGPGKDGSFVTRETCGQIPWQSYYIYHGLSGIPSTIYQTVGKSFELGWLVLKREGRNVSIKHGSVCGQ